MPSHSSFEELNEAIKNENPFDGRYVVKSQQVWGEEFPDIPTLNTYASDAILDTVSRIKEGKLSTFGITILAPKGVGKSHVLSRIRHNLQMHGHGVFIYMCEYGNLSHIKLQLLQGLSSSLRKRGHKGVMQCQQVATTLINHATQKSVTPQQVLGFFQKEAAKLPFIVKKVTEQIIASGILKDIQYDPYVLKAFIWTLSPVHAPFALNWLAGRELTQVQAEVMELPNPVKENKNIEAFHIACQILELISLHTVPVICFDELDGTEFGEDELEPQSGFTRAQIVASLAKDLYNNLRRGVIVTAMYPQTYKEVKSLPRSEAIEDRVAQKIVEFTNFKSQDAVDLVSGWLEDFYARQGLTPPHKVYPFDESQLREVGDGSTMREVLRWCADNFGTVIDQSERIERVYREVEESIEDFFDDNERIASAIAFGLQHLIGQTIEKVTIEEIDREVQPKSENRGFINFRILGMEDGQPVKIGVAVIQDSHGKTVGAGLKRLNQYHDFDLTRGCLVRSKTINESWSAHTELQKLLSEMGGEWVTMTEDHVKPLLALRAIAKDLEGYNFQQEHFYQFIEQNRLILDNPLLCEILSDPSGESPKDVIEEDDLIGKLSDVSDEASLETEVGDDLGAAICESKVGFDLAILSTTQRATFELYQQGLTIGRIAQRRRLSRSTIVRHIVDMIEMNQPIELNTLMAEKRQTRIRLAIEKTSNPTSLKSIREHLPDSYTYDEIQLVRAKWIAENRQRSA
ncbi:helix-turn-helix domain-containing protein [Leptolyngbya sp. AN02str]|uniref:helix-turn-helix domain-containing protein n=1 Tax=Leptolyngbya sp. AN02str TaxID=3423363 RepID=UPI003D30FDE4